MAVFEGIPGLVVSSSPVTAFSRLSAEQLVISTRYGTTRRFEASVQLYRQGERGVDLYVVVDGILQTFWQDEISGTEHAVGLQPGEFSGELNLLNQRETLVAARALPGSTVLRIPRDRLREFLVAEPSIAEVIMRTMVQRRQWICDNGVGGLLILSEGESGEAAKLTRFLTANCYPFRLLDIRDSEIAQRLSEERGVHDDELPAVLGPGWLEKRPGIKKLADRLGISEDVRNRSTWDVLIVGAGPAGLATAVYAASEGLRTLVVDSYAPGGQAGTSSRIENYLGFSNGISGAELAKQAQVQAEKFGAVVAVASTITGVHCNVEPFAILCDGTETLHARTVVIATGANYRKLAVPGIENLEGAGVHYSATLIDVQPCAGKPVVIVGGGNSAGQAAMFLSGHAGHVHMLIRGPRLSSTMSDYLVQRIHASKSITLHPCCEVIAVEGEGQLNAVTWFSKVDDTETRLLSEHLFVMIGADPCTGWLRDCVRLDPHGFVATSPGFGEGSAFETSVPGIFAVGDVRSGSVKRVASAVGEGSMVLPAVHRYLGTSA